MVDGPTNEQASDVERPSRLPGTECVLPVLVDVEDLIRLIGRLCDRQKPGDTRPLTVQDAGELRKLLAQLSGEPSKRESELRQRLRTRWLERLDEGVRDPDDALPKLAWLTWIPPALRLLEKLRPGRPPLYSRRLLHVALVVLVLVGVGWQYVDWNEDHCGGRVGWPGLAPESTMIDGECVGLTYGDHPIFEPSDPLADQVRLRIRDQNRQAEELHEGGSPRPYITLAHLDAYTLSSGGVDGLAAQRESLEGVAVAQSLQLKRTGNSDPLVRILIVNAGRGMRHGPRVARQLGEMARTDPSLVGVVGLSLSNKSTIETITALTEVGLPIVASTLSADSLADKHPMFYQISPQNRREAAVAAAFATHLRTQPRYAGLARTVRVYYSDDAADTYALNLRDDVVLSFRAAGFGQQAVAFTPNGSDVEQAAHLARHDRLVGNPVAAGRDACDFPGVVYFAGRGVPDFGGFVDGLAQCSRPPVVIAGDDVTRYVADPTARERNQVVPFWVQSFATAPTHQQQPHERNFYHELSNMFSFEDGEDGRSLDGHAALAYDAALTMITAVEYLREGHEKIPVTPGTVWREINDIHTSQNGTKALQGATGIIDFGGDVARHVPLDKPVAVLRVADGQVDRNLAAFCGMPGDPRQSPFCPPGER